MPIPYEFDASDDHNEAREIAKQKASYEWGTDRVTKLRARPDQSLGQCICGTKHGILKYCYQNPCLFDLWMARCPKCYRINFWLELLSPEDIDIYEKQKLTEIIDKIEQELS